jgi:5-methyltetrahydropteroyltriglutamate--homocysteine methyltransferase
MLTGPVTMLLWSYPRDDLDLADTCAQLALAIRDEVRDLEAAGVGIIQVDEPAFREGLPLREEERGAYLEWAVRCFRLATAGAADATQVHTHMCYADFGDILPAIDALDADVISLEAARSRMEVTGELAGYGYQRQVGPGVYDVHSPRVPTPAELAERIRAAAASLPLAQLWINPDCGLKTRSYDEVEPSLRAMVEAARQVRTELASQPMPGERGSMESPPDPPA